MHEIKVVLMDYKPQRLSEYSDSSLLNEVRRVAKVSNEKVLTKKCFQELSRVSVGTLTRRFGSWQKTLENAGLKHLFSGKAVSEKMLVQVARAMSDEDILNEIRDTAKRLGVNILKVQDLAEKSNISASVVRSHFGSWREGLRRAGLNVSSTGNRYSDLECFENIMNVWSHYGRQPKYLEMRKPPSVVGPKAYISKWGSWIQSVDAFMKYVELNNEEKPFKHEAVIIKESILPKSNDILETSIDLQRRVPLRYRYQVLVRDRFRCVLCGSSPSIQINCNLHVDHIVPFSKGGRTVLDNLRTLCEKCNLGKGDLYGFEDHL